jgi:hypothetical protein
VLFDAIVNYFITHALFRFLYVSGNIPFNHLFMISDIFLAMPDAAWCAAQRACFVAGTGGAEPLSDSKLVGVAVSR